MRKRIVVSDWSALSVSSGHVPGNFAATLDYVPGTAIRGALAAVYLADEQLREEVEERLAGAGWGFDEYFRWLFLSGKVRFPNLYLQPSGARPGEGPWVVPLSSRTCKYSPGYMPGDRRHTHDERHGVWDVLLTGEDDQTDDGCPACRAPLAPCGASRRFYLGSGNLTPLRMIRPRTRVVTRTAVENGTDMVRAGSLYSQEILEEGGEGVGQLVGTLEIEEPEGWSHAVTPGGLLVKQLELQITEIALGRAKSRGSGHATFGILDEYFEPPPLADRLSALNQLWHKLHPGASGVVFSLTLNSDALIQDSLWRYVSVLNGAILADEYPGGPPDLKLLRCFTGTRRVSGWNQAHRLPKPDELSILKGAAFLFHTATDSAGLLPWLDRIERAGLGERRHEGFGHVIACHPFHTEVLPCPAR
ncbi:MAG: hypothetical protein ACO1SX_08425 [Actinomycetota bacterium]